MNSIPVIPKAGDQQAAISTFTSRVYDVNEDGTVGERLDNILAEQAKGLAGKADLVNSKVSPMPTVADVGGSNRNLLINGDFRAGCLINQRGQQSYSGGYGIDMWWSGSTISVMVNSSSISITNTGTGDLAFLQRIENHGNYLGIPLCLSVQINGSIYSGAGTVPAVIPAVNTSYIVIPAADGINFVLRRLANTGGLEVQFQLGAGTSITGIERVKLELGSVSTLLNDPPPNPQQELAKCQRYLEVLFDGYTDYAFPISELDSEKNAFLSIPYKTPKRIAPSLEFIGDGDYGRIVVRNASGEVIGQLRCIDCSLFASGTDENYCTIKLVTGEKFPTGGMFPSYDTFATPKRFLANAQL